MAAFEGEHLLPCFRQVGGIDEAVVAAADDDYIVMLCHAGKLRSDFASRAQIRQIVQSKTAGSEDWTFYWAQRVRASEQCGAESQEPPVPI